MASQATIHFSDAKPDVSQTSLSKVLTRRPRKDELRLAQDIRLFNMDPITLECSKKVFDLDTKDDVVLFKNGTFTPAENTADALARVGNDSAAFMKIVNAGLRDYTREQIAADANVAWQAKDEEENLVPYTGSTITEEKSKQLAANVLNMAKMLFGYNKDMKREEKKTAKEKAQDMLLANPAVVDALKA